MSCGNCGQESADAKRWFVVTLIISVSLTVFLYKTDLMLSSSDKEKILGHELNRLRTAQSTLPSRVADSRQLSNHSLSK